MASELGTFLFTFFIFYKDFFTVLIVGYCKMYINEHSLKIVFLIIIIVNLISFLIYNPARSPVTKRREIRQLCENFAACEKSDILHELIGPVHSLQQPLVVESLGDRQRPTSFREGSSQPETITEEQVLITI